MNNIENFRRKIASGQTAFGCCISMYDPSVSELVADAGYDFLWIDMEHAPMTIVDAMHHVMAVRSTNCVPFVRVAWNDNYLIKPVLDLAPGGVIIPMVNNAREAEAAVKACRYPMHGGERGFFLRRNNGYGKTPVSEYLEKSQSEPLVIIQIEHKDAVKNIDEILSVSGVDSICIGPFDLSCSYGKAGVFDDPQVADAIDEVREKTLQAGIILGGYCAGPFWKDRFMNWKALTDDCGALYRYLVPVAETKIFKNLVTVHGVKMAFLA
jgi:2-keto-3-deoxy-L-rhamnonate aldolase RhmA